MPEILARAIARIPAGRWGLAVSGGSDSVALLHLAHGRTNLQLHAIHLDHETRAGQSTVDAEFVRKLCRSIDVPLTLARRSDIEPHLPDLPTNTQARFRALRLSLYRQAIVEHSLLGILQAHHADDQAETILMRLIRGTGIEGLCGISADGVVSGIRIVRPLLDIRKSNLQDYLRTRALEWREDASNASPKYARNQVRQLLASRPGLVAALLEVQARFAALSSELEQLTPSMGERIDRRQLLHLHPLVQLHALRKWAIAQGAEADDLTLELLERVRTLLEDMGMGPSVCLPGGVEVRRQAGALFMKRSARPAPRSSDEALEDPS